MAQSERFWQMEGPILSMTRHNGRGWPMVALVPWCHPPSNFGYTMSEKHNNFATPAQTSPRLTRSVSESEHSDDKQATGTRHALTGEGMKHCWNATMQTTSKPREGVYMGRM